MILLTIREVNKSSKEPMKALYICDNKEEWSTLNGLFSGNFPKIELICCLNTSDALDHLSYEGPFAIVMIEASIKDESPTTLGKLVLETVGERPIIFMGSEVHIKDRVDNDLYNGHPINGIILSPYDVDNFKEVISTTLNWAKQEEFEESIEEIHREELLPMKIRNFYMFKVVPYDVYLELTQTKFIKIIKRNQPYTHSKIQSYAKKNIKHLYLGKNDFIKMLEDGIEKVKVGLSTKNAPIKNIFGNQIRGALIIQQYIRAIGVTDDIQMLCTLIINTTDKIISKYEGPAVIIDKIPFTNGDFAEQAILTSYYCEAILHNLGWKSDLSRKKLGLASLLQDVTLSNDDLLRITGADDPNLQMFTKIEQDEYLSHPIQAAEIAKQFQGYSEADFIIAQQHEKPTGTGFPFGVTANKMTAHSCAFILASTFVAKLAATPRKAEDRYRIIDQLKIDYNLGNFKDPLLALEKTIKI